jgi:cyclopropane fatty-acyl-phospholipid synthase-like methyltransferase
MVGTSMRKDERARALDANVGFYAEIDEYRYLEGAPHLKHRELRELLSVLTADALGAGNSVLDIGAGSGLGSFALFGRGLKITAVDSSAAMLAGYQQRERAVEIVVADVMDWLPTCKQRFDLVTHVSMLHHIPDYLALLEVSTRAVRPGGSLLTFQDPLLYRSQPRLDRVAETTSYFSWRLFQGGYQRGLTTLSRRARGILLETAESDYGEYHVVRHGVDSDAIVSQLSNSFGTVRKVVYWSTQGRPQQWLGRRAGLKSYFAVVATNRL